MLNKIYAIAPQYWLSCIAAQVVLETPDLHVLYSCKSVHCKHTIPQAYHCQQAKKGRTLKKQGAKKRQKSQAKKHRVNYEFIRTDGPLTTIRCRSLHYKMSTNSTRIGRERRDALDVNKDAQDTLNREYDIPLAERADPGRTNAVIEGEIDVLRNQHVPLQQAYDEWLDRLERGGDYLNYVLIHGTKLGTEANNYIRRLQRSTNGF